MVDFNKLFRIISERADILYEFLKKLVRNLGFAAEYPQTFPGRSTSNCLLVLGVQ